jgi:hypothetical protein
MAEPTMGAGRGTFFKIDATNTLTTLVTFNGSNGAVGASSLSLVGTTLYGSAYTSATSSSSGLIFSVKTDGTGFTILHAFNGLDGSGPSGNL